MKLVVECEVCEHQYRVKTHAFPSAGMQYVKATVNVDDLDCPNCGAGGGHFNYHITADMVRELHNEQLGGFIDIKKALQEAEGDMDQAREILHRLGWA